MKHLEVRGHAGNGRISKIGSVHQADTVHSSECEDQSTIDPMNDLSLLRGSELGDVSVIGDLGHSLLNMVAYMRFLHVVVVRMRRVSHGVEAGHGDSIVFSK